MERTDTTAFTTFTLPAPSSATFDFSTPNNILITIPKTSTWRVPSHWHSPDHENCQLLLVESGRLKVNYHKQPRTGGTFLGASKYKFKPGYWTGWSPRESGSRKEETVVTLVVDDEGLERNVCSAILDADIFPYLTTTPFWLRGAFSLLGRLLPAARRWLLRKMCYIQLQAIYREHGYWEYHGGINALTWWQWLHPFDIGDHPAWTVKLQYRSQKIFSRAVQGFYYRVGTWLLGMRGDYPEYNPHNIERPS